MLLEFDRNDLRDAGFLHGLPGSAAFREGINASGKNTIQLVFTLDDLSSIHVTSAIWWLEGGSPETSFQLIPDIQAETEEPSPEEVIQLAIDYFLEQ